MGKPLSRVVLSGPGRRLAEQRVVDAVRAALARAEPAGDADLLDRCLGKVRPAIDGGPGAVLRDHQHVGDVEPRRAEARPPDMARAGDEDEALAVGEGDRLTQRLPGPCGGAGRDPERAERGMAERMEAADGAKVDDGPRGV